MAIKIISSKAGRQAVAAKKPVRSRAASVAANQAKSLNSRISRVASGVAKASGSKASYCIAANAAATQAASVLAMASAGGNRVSSSTVASLARTIRAGRTMALRFMAADNMSVEEGLSQEEVLALADQLDDLSDSLEETVQSAEPVLAADGSGLDTDENAEALSPEDAAEVVDQLQDLSDQMTEQVTAAVTAKVGKNLSAAVRSRFSASVRRATAAVGQLAAIKAVANSLCEQGDEVVAENEAQPDEAPETLVVDETGAIQDAPVDPVDAEVPGSVSVDEDLLTDPSLTDEDPVTASDDPHNHGNELNPELEADIPSQVQEGDVHEDPSGLALAARKAAAQKAKARKAAEEDPLLADPELVDPEADPAVAADVDPVVEDPAAQVAARRPQSKARQTLATDEEIDELDQSLTDDELLLSMLGDGADLDESLQATARRASDENGEPDTDLETDMEGLDPEMQDPDLQVDTSGEFSEEDLDNLIMSELETDPEFAELQQEDQQPAQVSVAARRSQAARKPVQQGQQQVRSRVASARRDATVARPARGGDVLAAMVSQEILG